MRGIQVLSMLMATIFWIRMDTKIEVSQQAVASALTVSHKSHQSPLATTTLMLQKPLHHLR